MLMKGGFHFPEGDWPGCDPGQPQQSCTVGMLHLQGAASEAKPPSVGNVPTRGVKGCPWVPQRAETPGPAQTGGFLCVYVSY